jgi:hypothetical protein
LRRRNGLTPDGVRAVDEHKKLRVMVEALRDLEPRFSYDVT